MPPSSSPPPPTESLVEAELPTARDWRRPISRSSERTVHLFRVPPRIISRCVQGTTEVDCSLRGPKLPARHRHAGTGSPRYVLLDSISPPGTSQVIQFVSQQASTAILILPLRATWGRCRSRSRPSRRRRPSACPGGGGGPNGHVRPGARFLRRMRVPYDPADELRNARPQAQAELCGPNRRDPGVRDEEVVTSRTAIGRSAGSHRRGRQPDRGRLAPWKIPGFRRARGRDWS